MCALLDDRAIVDDNDFIGVGDGRKAMGDDEAGAPLQEGRQGFLDDLLGLGVVLSLPL